MQKSTIIKTIAKLLVFLGLAAYLVFALVGINRPKEDSVCTGVDVIISDDQCTDFITEEEIRNLLVSRELDPEGKTLAEVDLTQLEAALTASPYIAEALCYKTVEGHISIQVTPRVPVLHVLNQLGEDFYIDNQGGTMPRRNHVVDLLVMTGNVPRSTAGSLYAPMGIQLSKDPFWSKEIEEIHVNADGELELTPRVGDFIILLGDTSQLSDKLERMHTFYSEGLDKVGWNRYKVINLKFNDQVIGVKK